MKKVLITGGTVFVSKFIADYYVKEGYEVNVLNRNSRPQVQGTKLIAANRYHLGDTLKKYEFDAVLDVTAYTKEDIKCLLEALGAFKDYIFISSGAVYPETLPLPFYEEQAVGQNLIWGDYGRNKAEAEQYLLQKVPQAYVLRPPYIYGPMQNLYREPFIFDCAKKRRPFYIPKDGSQKLQFLHVRDLCRFIDNLLGHRPKQHIYNVGNKETVNITDWVQICYEVVGVPLEFQSIYMDVNQREYFCFYNYEYELDVSKQKQLMPQTISLRDGLKESYNWYIEHEQEVIKKGYLEFIDSNFNL